MDTERYVFRRQFIFGPRRISLFPKWKNEELGAGHYLTVHPDLPYALVKCRQNYLVLLGYILDPEYPERTDEQIVRGVLESSATLDGVFRALNRMFGRYVVIASLNGNLVSFSDPMGARALFYCNDSSGRLWCASQSSILAELFGLSTDLTIEKELFGLPLFRGTEYWYPGNVTAYREISHLIPNHYLDHYTKMQVRYWPVKELVKTDPGDSLERVVQLWRGAFKALCSRFDSALGITAGLDSRILLAASRDVSPGMHYITHTHENLGITGPDIVLPSQMLPRLGLKHTILFHSEHLDPDFERIYRRNVTTARRSKGINAYAFFCHFRETGKERLVINGNGGEITRNFFFLPRIIPFSGFSLSTLVGMDSSSLAVDQFGSWLSEVKGIETLGYSILDLLYWEQRIGNWASMSFSEYDIAFESFSPFDSRELLESMLSVSASQRCWPDYRYHQNIIKQFWPETLEYKWNPVKGRGAGLRKSLRYSYIHEAVKAVRYLRFTGKRHLRATKNGLINK